MFNWFKKHRKSDYLEELNETDVAFASSPFVFICRQINSVQSFCVVPLFEFQAGKYPGWQFWGKSIRPSDWELS